MNDLVDSVEAAWEAERLRPKQLDLRSSRSFENIRNVDDNFYNDGALRLPYESSSGEQARSSTKTPV